jgi:hypothetical protein
MGSGTDRHRKKIEQGSEGRFWFANEAKNDLSKELKNDLDTHKTGWYPV